MQRHLAPIALTCVALPLSAQGPADGLRLFGAATSNQVHLVDSNSNVVHTWFSSLRPGLSADMEADGTLLRAVDVTPFTSGGASGGLQRVAFDSSIRWDFRYDSGGVLSHHDLEPLPNGNVLMIAWEEKTQAEAIAAGRNPASLTPGFFRPDHIVEVQQTGPTTGTVIWEWHVWDHVVQDFDPTQSNFGVVANQPERIDINYPVAVPLNGDWTHCNAIDYDAERDLILLSSLHNSEIWIVDH
ncbi:MAG: aryl-sulfate sulfotransferase [Planctomycetes bacterium]|nr:aryl-sulfate sulfotransferase [Planctomycetota bacterium]